MLPFLVITNFWTVIDRSAELYYFVVVAWVEYQVRFPFKLWRDIHNFAEPLTTMHVWFVDVGWMAILSSGAAKSHSGCTIWDLVFTRRVWIKYERVIKYVNVCHTRILYGRGWLGQLHNHHGKTRWLYCYVSFRLSTTGIKLKQIDDEQFYYAHERYNDLPVPVFVVWIWIDVHEHDRGRK